VNILETAQERKADSNNYVSVYVYVSWLAKDIHLLSHHCNKITISTRPGAK
jgi:hypothetical protein